MDEIYQCPTCGSVGKAPKNELIPLNFQYLNKFVMDYRKFSSFKGDESLVSAICEKFGSSGKRPLNEEGVAKKLYEMHNYSRTFESNEPKWDELSEDNKNNSGFRWQAKEICKEFSTAEVSLEKLEEIIMDSNLSTMCVFEAYARDVRDLAKALKAELDGK